MRSSRSSTVSPERLPVVAAPTGGHLGSLVPSLSCGLWDIDVLSAFLAGNRPRQGPIQPLTRVPPKGRRSTLWVSPSGQTSRAAATRERRVPRPRRNVARLQCSKHARRCSPHHSQEQLVRGRGAQAPSATGWPARLWRALRSSRAPIIARWTLVHGRQPCREFGGSLATGR